VSGGQHEGPDWEESPDSPGEEEEIIGGFRRAQGGVSARFTAAQAGIVRTLVSQVAELISEGEDDTGAVWQSVTDPPGPPGPGQPGLPGDPGQPGPGERPPADQELAAMIGATGPTSPPDDPVLARLFPDAYADDESASGEFRKYTEPGLRSGKVAAANTVLATLPEHGGRVRLAPDDAQAWLRALNDVRLALGTRLGITEDYEDQMEQADWADPRSAYLEVYHWLGYVQESLVRALW
jgi:uncharacterized protein DUF2017